MKKLLFLILIIAFNVSSLHSETTFTLLPVNNVVVGNKFAVTYRLKDGEGTGIQVKQIEGCKLLSGPDLSTRTSISIINGKQSHRYTVDYTYTYKAEKEGTFTIPAASITVDGKQLSSQPATFTILPPDSNTGSGRGNAAGNQADDATSTEVSDKDVFIKIFLNKSQAYKEEAIECTMKLYSRFEQIDNISAVSQPSFDGFLIENLDNIAANNQIEHYNGRNYMTVILQKYIIFPQQTGKLTINTGEYNISVVQYERVNMGFFEVNRPVQKNVRVKPGNLSLNVIPLPQPQPDNFSGAVGSFTINSELSSSSFRTNEASSLVLTISGSGNIKYLKEPNLSFPEEFEQYTPKITVNASAYGSTMKGTNSIEYTFVPQVVGNYTLPGYEFVYFNPQTKKYETLNTPDYSLNVAQGANAPNARIDDQQSIQAKNTDILHIKLGDKKQTKDVTPLAYSYTYWLVYVLLLLLLAGIVLAYSKHIKFTSDIISLKKAKANKVAKKRLNAAEKYLKQHNIDAFYEELLKAVWGYLGDKFSIPASQQTRQFVSADLSTKGIPQVIIDKLIVIIDDCEMARYTPGLTDESADNTFKSAANIIESIENLKIA